MKPEDVLSLITEKAKQHNVDQFDTMVLQSEDFSVEVFKKAVKGTEMSFSQGAGIRLLKMAGQAIRIVSASLKKPYLKW